MKYLAVILCLVPGVASAGEHWFVELPPVTLSTNETVSTAVSPEIKGVIRYHSFYFSEPISGGFNTTNGGIYVVNSGVTSLVSRWNGSAAVVSGSGYRNVSLSIPSHFDKWFYVFDGVYTNTPTVKTYIMYER